MVEKKKIGQRRGEAKRRAGPSFGGEKETQLEEGRTSNHHLKQN